jgi:hypothetical protein
VKGHARLTAVTLGEKEDREAAAADELIGLGAEIVGGVAATAVGFLAAGPPGALAGAAAGPVLTHSLRRVGAEVRNRIMGPREQVRVGAALAYAVDAIRIRLEAGESPRANSFIRPRKDGERSGAEEIAEAVLLAAQREHEENKLRHYGSLLASIAFDSEIDQGSANYLTVLVSSISYRQLCLLSLAMAEGGISPLQKSLAGEMLAREVTDLQRRGALIPDIFSDDVSAGGAIFFFLSELGLDLVKRMNLAAISDNDTDSLRPLMRFQRTPSRSPFE